MTALLVRGRIYGSNADALLVRDGLIVAVDSFAALRSTPAELLDAGNGLVLPGIVDGHAHPSSLGRALVSVQLQAARSMEDVVAACRAWAQANPSGWVTGRGWDQTLWAGAESLPTASALDAAFPDRPVYLTRVDGHAALANRAALRAAGIRDDVSDPDGGRFGRNATGRPDGLLVDNAMALVESRQPAPGADERARWISAAFDHCLSLGITGVHDAGACPDDVAAYESLAAAERLDLRAYVMIDLLHPRGMDLVNDGPRGRGRFTLRAVKLFADGALGSRGAELFEPYADDPGNSGLAVMDSERLREAGLRARAKGFQICAHAIGDRANARVLDVFERLGPLARPRVEHAQILRPSDFERFARLGVVAAMQPVHVSTDRRFAERRLGAQRLAGAYAWRSLASRGVTVAFGSDFPIEPANWLLGMHAATTRDGWRTEECVTHDVAIDAFTRANAFASFSEHELGSIRPGFKADLTILANDPRVAGDWREGRVAATVVGGRVLFRA